MNDITAPSTPKIRQRGTASHYHRADIKIHDLIKKVIIHIV
jgi:hypothetical protein